jgi:hypothetical protein
MKDGREGELLPLGDLCIPLPIGEHRVSRHAKASEEGAALEGKARGAASEGRESGGNGEESGSHGRRGRKEEGSEARRSAKEGRGALVRAKGRMGEPRGRGELLLLSELLLLFLAQISEPDARKGEILAIREEHGRKREGGDRQRPQGARGGRPPRQKGRRRGRKRRRGKSAPPIDRSQRQRRRRAP